MFFFELLFSYVSLQFPSMFSLANLFSIIPLPYLLITRDTQDEGRSKNSILLILEQSKNHFMT